MKPTSAAALNEFNPGRHPMNFKPTGRLFCLLFAFGLACGQPMASAQDLSFLTNGLVAYYPFNGNANDESGNGNDGVVHGPQLAVDRFGLAASAYSFDGRGNIEVPNSPLLNPLHALTVTVWVFVPWIHVGDIIGKDGDEVDRQYLINIGGRDHFRSHVGIPWFHWFDGVKPVQLGQWYHVAMTYDGASLSQYVDGVLDAQSAASGQIIATSQPLRIGGGSQAGLGQESQLFFHGMIDDARVYGRALAAAEVAALHFFESTPMRLQTEWVYVQPCPSPVEENVGEVVVEVRRSGLEPLNEVVTVDYSTADGTARAGEDYGAVSGTLTFAAGQTKREIRIPILNDGFCEGPEECVVHLRNLSGSASLGLSNCVLVIADNDLGMSFASATATANERSGEVVLTVLRQDDGTGPMTVDYATADQSARAGEDHTAVSGSLTFPAGSTQQQIRVPILDDAYTESAETFLVRLSNAIGGAGLGTPKEVVVILFSDEHEHTTLYVALDSQDPTPPYSSWATAATNLQDAVDLTTAGDTVLVTNGVYAVGGKEVTFQDEWGNTVSSGFSRVAVTNAIRLESVNGPGATTIVGRQTRTNALGEVEVLEWGRCVYLGTNAVLSGFTLTGGISERGEGGGAYCEGSAVVTNCVITGNGTLGLFRPGYSGAGVRGGTLYNCTISSNWTAGHNYNPPGGGAYRATLHGCRLIGNRAGSGPWGDGGSGAYECTLFNCHLEDNEATRCTLHGCLLRACGGAHASTLYDCTLAGNHGGSDGTFYNCTVTDNQAGISGFAYNCILTGNASRSDGAFYDCTVVDNEGGISGTAYNSIVYYNSGSNSAEGTTLNYCLTSPLPTNGVGNITGPPLFMDMAAGDFRLREDSPCIDAGTNVLGLAWTCWSRNPNTGEEIWYQSSITDPTDIVGNTRFIDGDGDGIVAWDIGAYEFNSFQPPRFAVHPQRTPDGWTLNVTGAPNKWARLERSSNLTDWEGIWSGWMGSEGVAQVNDGDTGSPAMFYRVVVP